MVLISLLCFIECFLSLNSQAKCHLIERINVNERHTDTNKVKETVTFSWHLLWIHSMNCNFATTVTSDTNQFDICHLWESLFFLYHCIDYVITLNDNKCHFSSFLHPEYISPRLSAPRYVFGAEVCGLIRVRGTAEESHRPRAFSVAINI